MVLLCGVVHGYFFLHISLFILQSKSKYCLAVDSKMRGWQNKCIDRADCSAGRDVPKKSFQEFALFEWKILPNKKETENNDRNFGIDGAG